MAKVDEPVFWEPGKPKPSAQKLIKLERQGATEGAGSTIVYNYQMGLSIPQQKLRLPVHKYREHILYLLENYQTLVLMGQTGCGKSTQIPQYLHEAGWTNKGYMVAITQPRRVAAISVASRVSDEIGAQLGSVCGYSIRFDDCSAPGITKIRFMTDGFLVREMMRDPLLSQYSVIIVDEAHERTIHTDIVLGLLKKVSLNILNKSLFKVSTSTILTIQHRMFPLEILYLEKSCPNYVEEAVKTALLIHQFEGRGDVLVFLTGQDEIDSAVSLLKLNYPFNLSEHKEIKSSTGETLSILPLYGSLPIHDQLKVFQMAPAGVRKVIFSTNISEASVTINGICFETLIVTEISKDSAIQRGGRAGRTRPEIDYSNLPDHTLPDIQRQEMSSLILQLKGLGVEKPPSVSSMANGIADDCELTDPLGRQIVEFPLDPMIGKMLLCSEEALTIAAMLQIESIFYNPSYKKKEAQRARLKFAALEGDHLTMLNVFNTFIKKHRHTGWCKSHFLNHKALCQAEKIRHNLKVLLGKYKIPIVSCGR
ncbi:hypothetical protein MXB_2111 [Myxobolus squamalis]|nr:hypothetical protein MXB_2111 [Myxobolus squamalis]